MRVIKKLKANGFEFENVPFQLEQLVELGLNDEQIKAAEKQLIIEENQLLIEIGLNAISSIIDQNYTTKMWKVSEYDKKRNEAEYILGLDNIEQAEKDKCRLITDEADERGVTILELAVIIQDRVIAYEAMIKGEREARKLLQAGIENASSYEEKLKIKDQEIAAFKEKVEAG